MYPQLCFSTFGQLRKLAMREKVQGQGRVTEPEDEECHQWGLDVLCITQRLYYMK